MAKGHRSQIKRERNANKDTRPSAKLSYARVSVQKACFVLDAIRGKDLETAIGIVTYNPRYASTLIKKLLEWQQPTPRTTMVWTAPGCMWRSATPTRDRP